MDNPAPHRRYDENEDGSVRVGMLDIYEILIVLRDEVQGIGHISRDAVRDIEDHEDRIRSLERWKYGLPIGAVAALVPGLIALLR